eukprot:CAMPEP_0195305272 /NCGR_PEP_ID=MMETSP0707-20130614/35986_1 /TAXON_ID=33640 /ORGANISM="Asterionellopsis glacialis, Strain CCMP134" /LENGTH=340 /DNA_ID=CAMNT_0040369343 /DNA_START=9 /DNA_END=1031 /DNA_ORIENTATION=+
MGNTHTSPEAAGLYRTARRDDDLESIIDRLSRNDPGLVHLNLWDYTRRGFLQNCTIEDAIAIANTLPHNTNLKKLTLTVQCFGYDGLVKVLEALEKNAHLEILDLSRMHLIGNEDTMAMLQRFLSRNRFIQTLVLSFFCMQSSAAQKLAELVRDSSLHTLRCTEFGDLEAKAFGKILLNQNHNKSLKELHLHDTGISDKGAMHIFRGLANNESLQTLVMHHTDISDKIADTICNFLQRNKSLLVLDIRDSLMSESSKRRIVQEGLENNYALERLYIDMESTDMKYLKDEALWKVRKLLKNKQAVCPEVWARVLGRKKIDPTITKYILQENPDLFQYVMTT